MHFNDKSHIDTENLLTKFSHRVLILSGSADQYQSYITGSVLPIEITYCLESYH